MPLAIRQNGLSLAATLALGAIGALALVPAPALGQMHPAAGGAARPTPSISFGHEGDDVLLGGPQAAPGHRPEGAMRGDGHGFGGGGRDTSRREPSHRDAGRSFDGRGAHERGHDFADRNGSGEWRNGGRRSSFMHWDGGRFHRGPRGIGPILVAPGVVADGNARRGWRDMQTPGVRRQDEGSYTLIVSDAGDRGSGGVISGAYAPTLPAFGYDGRGPKIIDVASERLDRRPMPSSGIDTISLGGPKIIRIAPGYRRSEHLAEAGSAPAGRDKVTPGEPWSRTWLARCSEMHESFDPAFGTYLDANGRSRFCDGF